jgi:hypothetical protein
VKIVVTHTDEEQAEAARVLELLRGRYPKARIHQKTANLPHKTVYLTVKPQEIH